MEGAITALIGVGGALAGTFLGWLLNSQSYKMGKTKIYSYFVPTITLPEISLDRSNSHKSESKTEYLFHCVASNSRQIPVILNDFHVEMKADYRSKPVNLAVQEPEVTYTEVNGIKIGVQCALPRQLIPPRTLYEFKFKVDYYNTDIKYSRLELVAYNEKHKRQKFLLYNGLKRKRPPI